MKRFLRPFLAALATALVIVPLIVIVFADNSYAALYLSPSSKNVTQGDTFDVQINLATNGQVGYVKTYLDFPADKLSVSSISAAGSSFNNKIEESSDNNGGHVYVTRSASSTQRGSLLVATMTFKAKSAGKVAVAFANSSKVSESKNSANILASSSSGSYTIAAATPPPNTPPPASHPPASNNPPAASNTQPTAAAPPATTKPAASTTAAAASSPTSATTPAATTTVPPAITSAPQEGQASETSPITGGIRKSNKPLLLSAIGGGVLLGSALLGGVMFSRRRRHTASVHVDGGADDNLHASILDDAPANNTDSIEPAPAGPTDQEAAQPSTPLVPAAAPADATDLYTTAATLEAEAQNLAVLEAEQTAPAPPVPAPVPVPTAALPTASEPVPQPIAAPAAPPPAAQPAAAEPEPKDMFELAEEQFHYDEKFKTPPSK